MRCPNCEKFVGLEQADPEEQSLTVTDGEDGKTFTVSGEYRLARTCTDCADEMQETVFTFDVDGELDHAEECDAEDRELEVEANVEGTDEGGGRYAKRMIGIAFDAAVTCSCGAVAEVLHKDSVAASQFDSLV
jgi:hypothetical protein